MSVAFHACPPPGQWIKDPNALVHAGGAWRLFVQHRDDGPAFRATGWARCRASTALDWRFDGQAGGDDKRRAVEARPAGMVPISATNEASSIESAVAGGADRALAAYDCQIGKRTDRKGR